MLAEGCSSLCSWEAASFLPLKRLFPFARVFDGAGSAGAGSSAAGAGVVLGCDLSEIGNGLYKKEND